MPIDIPRHGRDDLIPGYLVRRDGASLEAVRIAPLDNILRAYGCLDRVVAATLGELELLCTAERVKEGLITAALRVTHDTQPWRDPSPD